MSLVKKLIVNADDFGIHSSVNQGIVQGHLDGIITSASIMPGGEAFEEALELANANPRLGVGVHLTLAGEKPVADAGSIPSLLNGGEYFYDNYTTFITKYLQGKINLPEVFLELKAQIKKVAESRLQNAVTHLDSHQHLHVLPGIIDLVINLAHEFKIEKIRIPNESFFFFGGYQSGVGRVIGRSGLTALALLAKRKARQAGLGTPDNFFGMLAGGNLREEFLLRILDALPSGVSEIMIHPGGDDNALAAKYGWPYNWQAELSAAVSSRAAQKIIQNNIELISFKNLEKRPWGKGTF